MVNARIAGIASYVPSYILDNEELSQMVDTNDEWITQRVGIKTRRILKENEGRGSSFMGIQAVNKLLAETGVAPEDIDLLICATTNPDYRFPSTGSIIVHECGLKNAYSYDSEAACAGFLVSLQDATAYIRSGMYKNVIVVATEQMSSMTNYKDRATCPLFGDGAGAVLVQPTEKEGVGVIDGVFHVDGSGLPNLIMKAGGSAYPASHETIDNDWHYVYQEGRAVYKHAVSNMLSASLDVMKRNNLTADDISYLVPHQANLRIIEAVAQKAGIPMDKVLVNIQDHGNTSGATIPICLDDFKNKLKPGDKLILTAFGAGFTWGSMYVVWDI
ncbi:MAG: ketoacyl-ACP synthase III [Muribaculaceae bacterium]|nr:ketoacyl-ACP synthase III [Muribaculaceae bacterium]